MPGVLQTQKHIRTYVEQTVRMYVHVRVVPEAIRHHMKQTVTGPHSTEHTYVHTYIQ